MTGATGPARSRSLPPSEGPLNFHLAALARPLPRLGASSALFASPAAAAEITAAGFFIIFCSLPEAPPIKAHDLSSAQLSTARLIQSSLRLLLLLLLLTAAAGPRGLKRS